MNTAIDNEPVVNEEIWRAWVQKGKLSDASTARKAKALGGIVFVLLAVGSAFIFLG